MDSKRTGTVALVIRMDEKAPALIDTFTDDGEIAVFEVALSSGEADPLGAVYHRRERQAKEDEDFGNYVEELLSQPFVKPEIQEHGVRWLKSKMRIESFQKSEHEAASVIANYAFKLFKEDPGKIDYFLAGPSAQVHIRIFTLNSASYLARTAA